MGLLVCLQLDSRFMHRQAGSKIQDYTNEIKKVCTLTTVLDFWAVYCKLKRPGELGSGFISDYHFFKEGIRPIWEVKAH